MGLRMTSARAVGVGTPRKAYNKRGKQPDGEIVRPDEIAQVSELEVSAHLGDLSRVGLHHTRVVCSMVGSHSLRCGLWHSEESKRATVVGIALA